MFQVITQENEVGNEEFVGKIMDVLYATEVGSNVSVFKLVSKNLNVSGWLCSAGGRRWDDATTT